MSDQTTTPLPEAAYSGNFRMYKHGVDFLFTVRESDDQTFVSNLTKMIAALTLEGWAFPQQAQQQPVPTTGQAIAAKHTAAQAAITATPVAPTGNGAPLSLPLGNPPPQSGAPRMEAIEGYVLGTYLSKKTQQVEPAVWLYTARRPFKAYTVYPEQFDLLPFAVPVNDMSRFWNGAAPSREQAMGRAVYVVHPFNLPVVAQTNPDGSVLVNAKGYVEYRPARKHELVNPNLAGGQAPSPVVQQTSAAQAQVQQHQSQAAPFIGVKPFALQTGTPAQDALAWSMQDADDAVANMDLPEEVEEWFKGYRSQYVAYMPMGGKKTGDTQWQLLNEWCALQVGVTPATTIGIADVGQMPLAGLLVGMICDRYAEKAPEAPVEVVVDLLRRVSPTRGTEANPAFDATFAGALSRVFQSEYARVARDGSLAF